MTFDDYLLELFYLIDSEVAALNLPALRQRGPAPKLHDSEVITMELAGEFLRIDDDKGIWRHFRRYHLKEFPALAGVDRTRFVRQSADLWRVKQLLRERLAARLPQLDPALGKALWIFDSFPLRVCRFKRASTHKLFRGIAAYGRDPTGGGKKGDGLMYGFHVHLCCSQYGPCLQFDLAPANVSDWPMVTEILPTFMPEQGVVGLGDCNYWKPEGRGLLLNKGVELIAPFRKKSHDPTPLTSKIISRLRQIIEPVIGQLATRFNCQRTWARDLWHLTNRLTRKFLSHTAAVLINYQHGNPMLQLEKLIND